jgi:hypothetical protein
LKPGLRKNSRRMQRSNKLRCTLKEGVEHDYETAIIREIRESMAKQLQTAFDRAFLCDPPKSDITFTGIINIADAKSL